MFKMVHALLKTAEERERKTEREREEQEKKEHNSHYSGVKRAIQ